jgi:hypothetical protein
MSDEKLKGTKEIDVCMRVWRHRARFKVRKKVCGIGVPNLCIVAS